MSSSPATHPLVAAAHTVSATLDGVTGVDPMYLPTRDKARLLVELTRVIARMTALRADVLAVADDLASTTADRSPGHWLAAETRTDRREAIHDERLGATLRQRWPSVAESVHHGQITWEQAGIQFGPAELRRLGRKVLEVVAPGLADEHEHRALLAEERRARAATQVRFRPRGDGSTDLHARLPDPVAHRLRTYLEAYTSPRRLALDSDVDRLPLPRRRGHAFCALLESLPSQGLPRQGQTAARILVMIDVQTLTDDLAATGVAETSTGDVITAGEARRLACNAGILPVVLGGRSEILDLGRTTRLFKGSVRTALDLRDRECRAERCDIPAAWCEAHHRQPWSRGGPTNLADGVLLCPYHHHRAHDPAYDQTRMPNGDIRFRPRT